jgi:hypothetical protein
MILPRLGLTALTGTFASTMRSVFVTMSRPFKHPCPERQRWTCVPAGWPRRTPSRKSKASANTAVSHQHHCCASPPRAAPPPCDRCARLPKLSASESPRIMAEPQRITPALICKYQLSQSITSARTRPGLQSGGHPVQHGLVRPGDGWWCIAIGEDRRGRPPDCCSRSSSDPAACHRGAAPEFLRPGRYRRPGLDRSGTRPWRKSPYAPPVRVAAWGHGAEPRLLAGRVLSTASNSRPNRSSCRHSSTNSRNTDQKAVRLSCRKSAMS